jgi:pimeloyl-ACP methyl ester carboxylesterase
MGQARTFVLVHGGGHGGWCWRDVALHLRTRGHRVTTPTLTGLGERAHLLDGSIDLETHIEDVANHLLFEDLCEVVLVGHSYGGAVVIGVADRLATRLSRLVLLDAFVLRDGETCMDLFDPEIARRRLQDAADCSGGLTFAEPDASAFGVFEPAQAAWVNALTRPHPVRTYTTPLRLEHEVGNGLPVDYIACTDPPYPAMAGMHARAKAAGWPFHELATGHDAMVSAPEATADLLERIAAASG